MRNFTKTISKRAKFDANKYIKKHYVRDNQAIIPIKLRDKEEFFDKFDSTRLSLDEEVRGYIDEFAYDIPYQYQIVLQVECPDLSEEDKKAMDNVVKIYYGLEVADKDYDLKCLRIRFWVLNSLGILALIINIIFGTTFNLSNVSQYGISELLAVAIWFSFWEAADLHMGDISGVKLERLNAVQLYKSVMEFKES